MPLSLLLVHAPIAMCLVPVPIHQHRLIFYVLLISHGTGECCGIDGVNAIVGKPVVSEAYLQNYQARVGSRRPRHVSTSILLVCLVFFGLFDHTAANYDSDALALSNFYNASDGDNWRRGSSGDTNGWLTSDHCKWFGITCGPPSCNGTSCNVVEL